MLKNSPKETNSARIEMRKLTAYAESRKATPRKLAHLFFQNQGDRLIDYLCGTLCWQGNRLTAYTRAAYGVHWNMYAARKDM